MSVLLRLSNKRIVNFFDKNGPIFAWYYAGSFFENDDRLLSDGYYYENPLKPEISYKYDRYFGGEDITKYYLTITPRLMKSKKNILRLNGFVEWINLLETDKKKDIFLTLYNPNIYNLNNYMNIRQYYDAQFLIKEPDLMFIDSMIEINKKKNIIFEMPRIKPKNYSLDKIKKYIEWEKSGKEKLIDYVNFKFPVLDKTVLLPIERQHIFEWQEINNRIQINRLKKYIMEFDRISKINKIKYRLLIDIKKFNVELFNELEIEMLKIKKEFNINIIINIPNKIIVSIGKISDKIIINNYNLPSRYKDSYWDFIHSMK